MRYDDEISQEINSHEVIHPEKEEDEEEYDYENGSHEIPEDKHEPEHHEEASVTSTVEELPTVAPTTAPPVETTTAFDPNCGPDRGGCDHECRRVQLDETESHVECSCFPGYELNVRDGRSCTGEYFLTNYLPFEDQVCDSLCHRQFVTSASGVARGTFKSCGARVFLEEL